MPTYQAECPVCSARQEYVCRVDERDITPSCKCGAKTERRIFSAPTGYVSGKFEAFVSTVDGTLIRNARELKEHNVRNNVVNLNEGYSEEKVKSGDFGTKPVVPDKTDIVKDIVESVKAVSAGYKPTIEVQENE